MLPLHSPRICCPLRRAQMLLFVNRDCAVRRGLRDGLLNNHCAALSSFTDAVNRECFVGSLSLFYCLGKFGIQWRAGSVRILTVPSRYPFMSRRDSNTS